MADNKKNIEIKERWYNKTLFQSTLAILILFIFSTFLNLQLTKQSIKNLNQNIENLNQKVNIYEQNRAKIDSLQLGKLVSAEAEVSDFEINTRHLLGLIIDNTQETFFKKHNITESILSPKMHNILKICGFYPTIDYLAVPVYFGDDELVARFNSSSSGIIHIHLKNDSTITCSKPFISNETSCEELCKTKP